jgi:hypothetical protein
MQRLALITFLDGRPVDPGYGQPSPEYPSQGPGFPTHPIAPGGGGGHPWLPGMIGRPRPDQGLPGGHPSHGLPGGGFPGQGYPDQGLPGAPPTAIQLPVFPSDPSQPPDPNKPTQPIYIEQGRKFEVKWSVHYGWILVPVEDEGAQPKE